MTSLDICLGDTFDSVIYGVVTADSIGVIATFNKAAERLFGYSASEVVGRNVMMLMTEPDRSRHPQYLERYRATGIRNVMGEEREVRGLRKDGSTFPFILSITDSHMLGETVIIAFIHDLSDQKAKESELLSRAEKLAKVERIAHLGSWRKDFADGALDWSDETFRIFGFEPRAFTPTYEDFNKAVHPDDRAMVREAVRRAAAERMLYAVDHRIVRPDGTIRWVHEHGNIEYDESGQPLHSFGTVQDITERKHAERQIQELNASLEVSIAQRTRELEESRNLTELLLDTAGEGILGIDADGVTTFANPAAYEMLGYSAEDLLGQVTHPIIHHSRADGSPYPPHECPIRASVLEGDVRMVSDEVLWRKDGSSIPVRYTTTPMRKGDKIVGAVVTFNDISDILERENELRRYAKELERSNEDLQIFAYAASHDLQEPLRKIQAFSERLTTKFSNELGDRGRTYIERIEGAATRMRALIDDLLLFSRVSTRAQAFTPTSLDDIIAKVLDDLETGISQAGATIAAGRLPTIDADPTQMRQLFQNIVSNSLKFRKPAEPLAVDIRAEMVNGAVPDSGNARQCRITVRDNGIGFEPRFAERIFGMFERLHGRGEYPGTGIGLATCKKIVERHGGTIIAEGAPGVGTTFTMILPISQSKETEK